MENYNTYEIYKGTANSLKHIRPTVKSPSLRQWWWKFSFALLFSLTVFTLFVSFLDDEILIWMLSLISNNKTLILEGAIVLLPVYQISLLFFLLVLFIINHQCILIRERNKYIAEQENLIQEMIEKLNEK